MRLAIAQQFAFWTIKMAWGLVGRISNPAGHVTAARALAG